MGSHLGKTYFEDMAQVHVATAEEAHLQTALRDIFEHEINGCDSSWSCK